MAGNDISIFNELSEFINLRMKSYREQAHKAGWVEYKAHIDYDLWFIMEGSVEIVIEGYKHIASAGDVMFFYPGIAYMATMRNEGCRFIYVHFDFEIGKQQRILSDFQLCGVVPRELIAHTVQPLIQGVKPNLGTSDSSVPTVNRLFVRAQLTAIVAKIIELYGQGLYQGEFELASRNNAQKAGRSLELLQPVFNFINDHLQQPIRMVELAGLIGISEKYFITYFKQALGITPGQYIYQIKMNRARDYLLKKTYSIGQIASLLGYPDPFTFSKAFKKYYGIAPSQFE